MDFQNWNSVPINQWLFICLDFSLSFNYYCLVADLFHLAWCPQGHPCHNLRQFFQKWWVTFCFVWIHFVCLFIHWWTFGLLLLISCVNNAAVNTCMQIPLLRFWFQYFEYISRSSCSGFYFYIKQRLYQSECGLDWYILFSPLTFPLLFFLKEWFL